MLLACCVMQSNFKLLHYQLDLALPCTLESVLHVLQSRGWIDPDQCYGYAVYGRRIKSADLLYPGDRLDCVLDLTSSPVDRRRAVALKRKNR